MFPEALMLHYLDDLDSKMEAMRAHFQREPGAEWTTYNASLARPLLNSKNFLEKLQAGNSAAPAVQPDAVQPAAVQAEAVRSDNVPESSKAAAAKEQEHSIKGL
jgi:3'-5' exoribonuclease